MKLIIGAIVATSLAFGSVAGGMAIAGSGSAQPQGCVCVDCVCPCCDGVNCCCEEGCEFGVCESGCAK